MGQLPYYYQSSEETLPRNWPIKLLKAQSELERKTLKRLLYQLNLKSFINLKNIFPFARSSQVSEWVVELVDHCVKFHTAFIASIFIVSKMVAKFKSCLFSHDYLPLLCYKYFAAYLVSLDYVRVTWRGESEWIFLPYYHDLETSTLHWVCSVRWGYCWVSYWFDRHPHETNIMSSKFTQI